MAILELVGGLVILVIGAQIFTNAVEWVGKKLNLGASGVGSVLAAVGTALPESMVPILAILGGKDLDIGVGAILGAPFMLATLGFGVVGITAAVVGRKQLNFDARHMNADLRYFIMLYIVAIAAGLVDNTLIKYGIGIILILAYLYYVYRTLSNTEQEMGEEHELAPLYLSRKNPEPSLLISLVQMLGALGIIIVGAHIFVAGVEEVAIAFGIPTLITAMIITPIATELPEKFNSAIWVKQGKDSLAMGNMTGAMVFQGSLIVAIGIFGTPWDLDPISILASSMAILSAAFIWFQNRQHQGKVPASSLILACLLYLVYLGIVVWQM